ncbi:MAG: hypothetical protein H8E94_09445 [Alphaproteobacteria bacterium]|nr:hypothetical protein [Alphaproteobacteria bacterium]
MNAAQRKDLIDLLEPGVRAHWSLIADQLIREITEPFIEDFTRQIKERLEPLVRRSIAEIVDGHDA